MFNFWASGSREDMFTAYCFVTRTATPSSLRPPVKPSQPSQSLGREDFSQLLTFDNIWWRPTVSYRPVEIVILPRLVRRPLASAAADRHPACGKSLHVGPVD